MVDVKSGLHWQTLHTIFVKLSVFDKVDLFYSSPVYNSTPCQHGDSVWGGHRAAKKQVALRKASLNDGSLSRDRRLSVNVVISKRPRIYDSRSHLHLINRLPLVKDQSPWNIWWSGDFLTTLQVLAPAMEQGLHSGIRTDLFLFWGRLLRLWPSINEIIGTESLGLALSRGYLMSWPCR